MERQIARQTKGQSRPGAQSAMGLLVMAPLTLLLTMALLSAGCRFSMPKDLYQLHGIETCEEFSDELLLERVGTYNHASSTAELKCTLARFRNTRPRAVHMTSAPAKVCYLLADRHLAEGDRERLAAEGVRWAEIAMDGDPALALYGIGGDDTIEEGRVAYYLALNLGIAVHDHTALAIKNIKKLARELKKAVNLSPDEENGGPQRVLGLLYLVAPPWPQGIGDGDKALALLEKVAKQHPEHPLNHVFYAQALWELEEDEAEKQVREHLAECNRLLETAEWGQAKERWNKLLRELAKEADVNLLPVH